MTPDYEIIGKRMKQERVRNKLTQEEINSDIYLIRSFCDEKNNKKFKYKIEDEYKNSFKLLFSSTKTIEPNEGYRIYKYIKN